MRAAPGAGDESTVADQTDRVILRAAEEEAGGRSGDVVVVDDATGALTAGALAMRVQHQRVFAWCSSRAETAALAARFAGAAGSGRLVIGAAADQQRPSLPADCADPVLGEPAISRPAEPPASLPDLLRTARADLVLMRLPKALQELDARARELARTAADPGTEELVVVAGARVKHMTRTQNDVLARSFARVHATRGLGKSRALVAAGALADVDAPVAGEGDAQVAVRGEPHRLALRGYGGVFGSASADAGSLLLLEALDEVLVAGDSGVPATGEDDELHAVDLGSGNGLLTAYLAAALPRARVTGSDDHADAVRSTCEALAANGLDRAGVAVTWDTSIGGLGDASADLVLLNPPFHDRAAIDPTLVHGMLDAVARVLRPGGELWFVHNSYLRYRPEVEHRIGDVQQRARDRRFTVLRAIRRDA